MKDDTKPTREDKGRRDDAAPDPGDSAKTAAEKSRSVDERVGDERRADDTIVAGAPAASLPQMGVGIPTDLTEDAGPGEAALDVERRGVRSRGDIQRG
jgi:hypothetical protein